LIFIGLSSRPAMYSIAFQYSSVLFPVLLVSLPDGIYRLSQCSLRRVTGNDSHRLRYILIICCFITTLLCAYKYGTFWSNEAFKPEFREYVNNRYDSMQHKKYEFV